jgi:hypothetical protein
VTKPKEGPAGDSPSKVTIPHHLAVKAEKSFRELATVLSRFDEKQGLSRERWFDQVVNLQRSAYAMGIRDGRRDKKRRGDKKAEKPSVSDLLFRRIPPDSRDGQGGP